MSQKKTPSELCDEYYNNYRLERRCGKWYVKKREIRNINSWLAKNSNYFNTARDVTEFIDMFNMKYHDPDADWYPLPIVSEAMKMIEKNEMKPLCFPLNRKQLMIINYIVGRHDEEIMIILTGIGGSGKSTFMNIIRQIVDNDVANCSLSDLSNRFKLEKALQHRLIASDELNSEDLNNGDLKRIISNQYITVEQKNQQPYEIRSQSVVIQSCNIRPRINLVDTGMLRRTLYYSMNEKVRNPNPLMKKLQWDHQDLVNIVAHALTIDMTDWIKDFEEESHFYLLCDNPVFKYRRAGDYARWLCFCEQNGFKSRYNIDNYNAIMDLINEWDMFDIKDEELRKKLCSK